MSTRKQRVRAILALVVLTAIGLVAEAGKRWGGG